jgi:hypothetical protein
VLGGRCYEREKVPHNAFDGLIEALTRHLLGLSSERARSGAIYGAGAAFKRLHAASRGLAGVSGVMRRQAVVLHGTVVLAIDDLHWADADSAALVAELVAVPAPVCLLLVSYRVTGIGPAPVVQALAQRLRGVARVWELALEPLTREDAEALAQALLGPGALAVSAGAIARESAGLPLFVHELVHDVLAGLSSGSSRLEDVIATRVARLPEPARALLELLTVAARPLPGDVVIGLLDRPAAVRAALHQLSVTRLVRTSRSARGELIELYHDRIREPVLAGLDAVRLRVCHARLAQTLLALPEEARGAAEVLAQHLHAAGDAEGARAYMAVAVRAASEALAFARAAELSLAAIALLPFGAHDDARALRIDAAQALLYAGNNAEAAACFPRGGRGGADGRRRCTCGKRAAEALLVCGALTQRGEALLQAVLRGAGFGRCRRRGWRCWRGSGRSRRCGCGATGSSSWRGRSGVGAGGGAAAAGHAADGPAGGGEPRSDDGADVPARAPACSASRWASRGGSSHVGGGARGVSVASRAHRQQRGGGASARPGAGDRGAARVVTDLRYAGDVGRDRGVQLRGLAQLR